MTYRITPHRQFELGQLQAQARFTRGAQLQRDISSGIRVHRPADDPRAQAVVLSQQSAISRFEVQLSSVQEARSALNNAHVQVREAQQLIVQAKTLTLQARGATETSEFEVLAGQVETILQQMQSIANASLGGRALFSGTATGTQPFVMDGTGAVVYEGSQQAGHIPLAGEADIKTYFTGEEVFQPDGGIDIFQTLAALRDDLAGRESMSAEDWHSTMDQRIGDLEAASNQLLGIVGQQGVALEHLDRLEDRIGDLKLESQRVLTEVQGTDYTTALIQLQEEQNLLQFTLASLTTLSNTTILDFLK